MIKCKTDKNCLKRTIKENYSKKKRIKFVLVLI